MVKRNASDKLHRNFKRMREKTAGFDGSAKTSTKRDAAAGKTPPVTPVKRTAVKVAGQPVAEKPSARKTGARKMAAKTTVIGKAAGKGPAAAKSTMKAGVPKKKSAAKKVAAAAKKPAGGKSAVAVRVTRSKAASSAIMLQQVEGWNVVDVVDGIAVHDSSFTGVHYLNHTAAAMYLLCKEPISLSVMSAILREEFSLDRDPGDEIENTVEEMMRIGLIRKAGNLR